MPETVARTGTQTYPAESTTLLADVRRFVASASAPYLEQPSIHDLVLAVTEACANAIRHSGSQEIRVTVVTRGPCVEIVVEDDGVYRMSLPVTDGDPGSHRGMYLMAAMVDDFSLHRGTAANAGTTVRLLKCAS
jgi:serine/threonine-protein kinase RsbW